MGNTTSCTPYSTSRPSIKVIDNDGGAQEYIQTVRAAELMLENPGQFVCDSNHLRVGCRIPGLAADDELEPHSLYFLLPMDLLYSVLTEEEMVSFSCKASTKTRCKNIGRRIFPVLSDFCLIPSEAKKVVEEPATTRRVDMTGADEVLRQRSWRPALNTIEEAPCMMQ